MPQLSLSFQPDELEKLWGAEPADERRDRIYRERREAVQATWDEDTRYERMAYQTTVQRSRAKEPV